MPIVGEHFLRAFYRLFNLQICDSNDQWKTSVLAKVLVPIRGIFLHENNRHYDSWRFSYKFTFIVFFFLSHKSKTTIRFSASWWSGNKNYFCFLFKASRALLRSHAEFKKLLQRSFLTCYSCLYYSSLRYVKLSKKSERFCSVIK